MASTDYNLGGDKIMPISIIMYIQTDVTRRENVNNYVVLCHLCVH